MAMNNSHDLGDETKPLIRISRTSSLDKAKARWITVEPILILAYVGIGTFSTIQAQYLQQRIAHDVYNYTYPSDVNESCGITNTSHPDYIIQQKIQQEATNWSLYLSICSTLPVIFSVIAIGKWSDIKGRKVAILVSLLGMLVQYSVTLIVINHHLSLSLLYIAELAHGVTGGNSLLVSISFAYIADITTSEQRTFRVVIIQTCLTISNGIAQLAIGYLISFQGFNTPFYLILSCQVAAILYTCCPKLLYESFELKTGGESFLSQMSKLFHGISDLFLNNENNRRWRLLLINVTIFLVAIVNGNRSIKTLYLIGQPFCWSSVLVGVYNAVSLSISSIGNIVGAKLLGICLSDIWILYVALVSSMASITVIGLAEDTITIFLSIAIGCLRMLPLAITRSMASKFVSASEQGVTFSVLAALDSLGSFIGPLLYQSLYSRNVVYGNPGTPFFVAAGLGALSEIFVIILHCGFLTCKSGKPRGP